MFFVGISQIDDHDPVYPGINARHRHRSAEDDRSMLDDDAMSLRVPTPEGSARFDTWNSHQPFKARNRGSDTRVSL
jgi:hypothetical protein